MPEHLKSLATRLHPKVEKKHGAGEETFEVSAPVSTAASLYERVRNTLDYQEEHLLRRNAILRILKRFLNMDVPLSSLAGDLLKELVWAKYLPNKTVPVSLRDELAPVIAKYEPLFRAAEQLTGKERKATFDWLLDVIATEIETMIAPNEAEDALVAYMYDEMRKRIEWDPRLPTTPEQKDLRLFIGVHKTLLKSNPGMLRYRVFTLYYPVWIGKANDALILEIASNLRTVVKTVEDELHDPLTDRLSRMLRRRAGIFRVLGDAVIAAEDIDVLMDDPEKLDEVVSKALANRTNKFQTRLRRTVVRTVIFLFITKMFLALLLELPYDLFLARQEVPLYPLFVNILFHPMFLALIGLTVSIPQKKNREDYLAAIRALSVGADHPVLHLRVKHDVRGPWQNVFDALYMLLFLGVYGIIAFGLHSIDFHWLSITLFLFFLSLVTFFGIRIRSSAREIVASDARSSIVGTAFDILLLPIVRAGSWLSSKVSKINVFIYFFDFIVEAPLKVAIEFIESWLSFVREKKEEI
ncbi:MAG TPA: hypothetical protein PLK06_01865 [bacterium]|nr:hypothetical protein [bacterium]